MDEYNDLRFLLPAAAWCDRPTRRPRRTRRWLSQHCADDVLLNSEPHSDHGGGLRVLQQASRAQLPNADALKERCLGSQRSEHAMIGWPHARG